MLAYHVVDYTSYAPDQWATQGLQPPRRSAQRLHATYPDTTAPIVVVDTALLPASERGLQGVRSIPPQALRNVDPYRIPAPVAAAGGYVTPRAEANGEPVVCTMHRRGVWDLPKGKQDKGESLRTCAIREVCEEIGISSIRVRAPLGVTIHGYATPQRYMVKTTHWFLMHTPARSFTPQTEERIRRVAWARWSVVRNHIGYETLRNHMDAVAPRVHHLLHALPSS